MNPVLYVILNGSLNMSAGKAAAQAVHAAMMLPEACRSEFSREDRPYRRTVIVLEANNSAQIEHLAQYLDSTGMCYETYIDEGENEVPPFSLTALAVETIDEDDDETRGIFASLPLYGKEKHETKKYHSRGRNWFSRLRA